MILFWVLMVLAGINILFVLITWWYYFHIWWSTRDTFEGAVPFHVVSVGLSYLIFALMALERLDGWRGPVTLMAYSMATVSLLWVLWYERTRFLHR